MSDLAWVNITQKMLSTKNIELFAHRYEFMNIFQELGEISNTNKSPIVVNAGGKSTVKTSLIPLVRLADRKKV